MSDQDRISPYYIYTISCKPNNVSHDYENEIGLYDKIYINQKMMKSIESKLFWVFLVGKT